MTAVLASTPGCQKALEVPETPKVVGCYLCMVSEVSA